MQFKFLANALLFIPLTLASTLSASTMYTLSDVKKVYPVVEISTKIVPEEYKETIKEEITNMFEEIGLDYSGYDQRAFAVLVNSIKIKDVHLVTVKILIGEPVKRLGANKPVFAETYIDSSNFILTKEESVEDKLEDTLALLLDRFSEQYKEENKKLTQIKVTAENFAEAMHYETSYEEAVTKAKKLKKDIMLVLVANFCPWCRKFEQRVLLKKDVNDLIQKKYIPLILNKEKDPFPKEYDKAFTPIVYFIDHETLKSHQSVVGYNNKEEFFHLIKKGK